MRRPCVFFDRDGVVNESPGAGYVMRRENFRLIPGFVQALRAVTEKGWAAVVVTNQQGVGKKLFTEKTLAEIHAHMRAVLYAQGLHLLDVLACTHLEEAGCACRKPKPGMLLEAARRHGLDLARSWMAGDNGRDIEAGKKAGCATLRIGADRGQPAADFYAEDMAAAAILLERELDLCRL